MTEYAAGQNVRTLVDITDDHRRELIPAQVTAQVIGFAGNRLLLSWDDEDGENVTALAEPWEVQRVTPRVLR